MVLRAEVISLCLEAVYLKFCLVRNKEIPDRQRVALKPLSPLLAFLLVDRATGSIAYLVKEDLRNTFSREVKNLNIVASAGVDH